MNNTQTSPISSAEELTQHAMLLIWGLYARQIGLVQAIQQVKLKQKHVRISHKQKCWSSWSLSWPDCHT